mgnify:CR=1 FL=1
MSKIVRINEWGVPAGVKSLWNKAKGHNLPRVKVLRDMTADQRERAYKRFRRTAGLTVREESKLDRVKGILRKMFRKPIKGGEEKQSD